MIKALEISLVIRTAWAFVGVILGTYALVRVWKRWQLVNTDTKIAWWAQAAFTPLSGLFVLWITLSFRGFVVQTTWQIALILFVSSLLALPNAFWLLVEETKKKIALVQV